MLRKLAILLFMAFTIVNSCTISASPVRVRGYTRKDGIYVAPHYRSTPDKSKTNNWSAPGNSNPYTGKENKATSEPLASITTPSPIGSSPIWVNGYLRSDRTYVPGYYRSAVNTEPKYDWPTPNIISSNTKRETTVKLDTYTDNRIWVNGYSKADGTYVPGHYTSIADGTTTNNWTSYGNVNPTNGKIGKIIAQPITNAPTVWVRGYFKADGSYVSGYYKKSAR